MDKTRIRKDDIVFVIKGKDSGKTGKVLKVIPEKNRAVVEKINFAKEFIRRDQSKNVQGGVMEKEAAIALSNLMIYCSECAEPVRIRMKTLDDGSRVRVCHKCDMTMERQK